MLVNDGVAYGHDGDAIDRQRGPDLRLGSLIDGEVSMHVKVVGAEVEPCRRLGRETLRMCETKRRRLDNEGIE